MSSSSYACTDRVRSYFPWQVRQMSTRVLAVCRLVPSYMDIYFDILLRYAPSGHVCALVPVMVERIDLVMDSVSPDSFQNVR